MMDLYKIICPYCKHEHIPNDSMKESSSAYSTMFCEACVKPFVSQITWTTVYVSFALVGVEQPEEQGTTAVKEKEETATLEIGWYSVPGTGASYYPTETHVSTKYQGCSPARLAWVDIEYLLSVDRENRRGEIARALGNSAQARRIIAVNMFLNAVEHDKIPQCRMMIL